MPSPEVTESSSRTLAVLGTGLTTPFGITAQDHAFFLRARLRPTIPPPYLDQDGEALTAHFCRWLGAELSVPERMERMAFSALGGAAVPLLDRFASGWDVVLVVDSERPGLDDSALTAVRSAAQTLFAGKRASYSVHRGSAGCQRGLIELANRLESGQSQVGCVLAVDSYVCPEAVAEDARTPVIWRPRMTPLSEGAAALVVVDERRLTHNDKALGRLLYSASVRGAASDLNDEPLDGYALTHLFRQMPDLGGSIPAVFGPKATDALRSRDWQLASARNHRRFCEPYAIHDLEETIGRVGAAAGAAHLVYALASLLHRTAHPSFADRTIALSWNISRDGWRAVTLLQGGVA